MGNNINIEEVINIKELQELQDKWAEATDLAFITVDLEGKPLAQYSNFTPFCLKLRENEKYRERCFYCDACGGRKAKRMGHDHVYICHAGLVDFSIPIMIKGQQVGSIQAGQVKVDDPGDLKALTKLDDEWKSNEELKKLYDEVQVSNVEKIKSVSHLLYDNYNYVIEQQYANKVEAELREKDLKLMKEEKLRIEMEKSLRDIELKALHYQINPHFLFNVLNTIGRLAFFENAKMTEDVVYAFSDMMRYILRKSSSQLSSLNDEITYILNYLKIQKIRLGSRLQYTIDIPEEFYQVKIPFLTLTTIVENSIKHAIEKKAAGGTIRIVGRQEKKNLVIEVIDDGDGMSPAQIASVLRGDTYQNTENGAVGIYNVNSRLIHHFGNEYALSIESENKPFLGTKVIIKVPLEQKEEV